MTALATGSRGERPRGTPKEGSPRTLPEAHPSRLMAGSLLIITLWLVTILSLLAVAMARSLSLEVRVAKYRAARSQAAALARDGVYLASRRLAEDAEAGRAQGASYDWPGEAWAQEIAVFGDGDGTAPRLVVAVADEQRKLSLNGATGEQLIRLTGSAAIAQPVLDARLAKRGPFAALEELSDVPEMTPDAYAALRQATSPYLAPTEPINLNTAAPEVLRAAGLGESTVALVMHFRDGPDGPSAHEQDGVFTGAGVSVLQALTNGEGVDLSGTPDGTLLSSPLFGVASDVFTVVSEGRVERPAVRVRVEAVVRRSGCAGDTPSPCIIAWREG